MSRRLMNVTDQRGELLHKEISEVNSIKLICGELSESEWLMNLLKARIMLNLIGIARKEFLKFL